MDGEDRAQPAPRTTGYTPLVLGLLALATPFAALAIQRHSDPFASLLAYVVAPMLVLACLATGAAAWYRANRAGDHRARWLAIAGVAVGILGLAALGALLLLIVAVASSLS